MAPMTRDSSAAKQRAYDNRAAYPAAVPQQAPQPQIQPAPPQQQPRSSRQAQQGKAKLKMPYGKYGVLFCSIFAAALIILFNYMKVTELTNQNANLREELETLQSDGKALDAKREQVFNLSYVEDRARNALGMVKADKSQVEYLDLSQQDLVEIPGEQSNAPGFVNGFVKSFNAVLEYLK